MAHLKTQPESSLDPFLNFRFQKDAPIPQMIPGISKSRNKIAATKTRVIDNISFFILICHRQYLCHKFSGVERHQFQNGIR